MKKLEGGVTVPQGFKSAGTTCGIKESGKKDLALVYCENAADTTAVFTKNEVKAAPVQISQSKIKLGIARAIIANSGNANACTGKQGMKDAETMVELTAENLSIPPE